MIYESFTLFIQKYEYFHKFEMIFGTILYSFINLLNTLMMIFSDIII